MSLKFSHGYHFKSKKNISLFTQQQIISSFLYPEIGKEIQKGIKEGSIEIHDIINSDYEKVNFVAKWTLATQITSQDEFDQIAKKVMNGTTSFYLPPFELSVDII